MLREQDKRKFIEDIKEGVEWDHVYKFRNDMFKPETGYAIVSFINSGDKFGESINYFDKKNSENGNYNDYSYGDVTKVYIRTWCEDVYNNDPWQFAWNKIEDIETFLKVNHNNLIISGCVDIYSFEHPNEIVNPFINRMYGYELPFRIITANKWTDLPTDESNRDPEYPLSGIGFGETGTFNFDVTLEDADEYFD